MYLGFSPAGRAVAVKVIHPHLARDPAYTARFRREVAAAQAVNAVYAAPVVAAGPDDTPPWLATAFVPAPTLQDVVAKNGPLPEEAVLKLAAGVAEGLRAIHASGLVHRDLKPGNVLLAADGPRLIDFGIARVVDGTRLTTTDGVLGTPSYMSPEQARGSSVDPPSDIFSLGGVVYFAATGQAPFGGGIPAALLYRIVVRRAEARRPAAPAAVAGRGLPGQGPGHPPDARAAGGRADARRARRPGHAVAAGVLAAPGRAVHQRLPGPADQAPRPRRRLPSRGRPRAGGRPWTAGCPSAHPRPGPRPAARRRCRQLRDDDGAAAPGRRAPCPATRARGGHEPPPGAGRAGRRGHRRARYRRLGGRRARAAGVGRQATDCEPVQPAEGHAGQAAWRFNANAAVSGIAQAGNVVYAATNGNAIFAINATTGKQIWKITTTSEPTQLMVSGGSVVVDRR